MRKQDLRSDDKVVLRDGMVEYFFWTTQTLHEEYGVKMNSMARYDDNLLHIDYSESDIMEVWRDGKLIWERQEISDDEKIILKMIGKGYIARDESEELFWYKEEPYRSDGLWDSCNEFSSLVMFPDLLQFITWESELFDIEEFLENEQKNL